ncbi:hypothetical protein H711_02977 [Brucella ovis IntaBari-2009-88-3]|nr:hypothetical protein H711_02977 [Brucella ovis IntaBari-2009-88-3]
MPPCAPDGQDEYSSATEAKVGRLRNDGCGKPRGRLAGGVARLLICRVGSNQNVACFQNGRAGEAMAVVLIVTLGFIAGGRRHVHFPFDDHAHKRILIGFGVFLMFRLDADFPCALQEKLAHSKGAGR